MREKLRTRRLPVTLLAMSLALEAGALILRTTHPHATYDYIWEGSLSTPVFAILGYLLATRRPDNLIGWVFAIVGVGAGLQTSLGQYAVTGATYSGWPAFRVAGWLSAQLQTGVVAVIVLLLFLFPTGRLVSPKWRPAVWAMFIGVGLAIVSTGFVSGNLESFGAPIRNPLGLIDSVPPVLSAIAGALIVGGVLASLVSLFIRYRRCTAEDRTQIKLFVFVAFIGVAVLLASGIFGSDSAFGSFIWTVVPLSLPASAAIAILRYGLYDIDLVINKTIVFGALAAFITAVYVAIVVGIGGLLGAGANPNIGLSIAATAIVAIAFSPVKERVQRFANRIVYGRRVSPYEVLSDLAKSVAGAESPESVLGAIVQAAAVGINASEAVVALELQDESRIESRYPEDAEPTGEPGEDLAITHRGENLGTLQIRKPAGDPLTPQDRKLCADLVSQAGLGLFNARLVLELRARVNEISIQARALEASRARIVAARDDSRLRLERDISSGPRVGLEAIAMRLQEIEESMAANPESAAIALEALARDATTTLDSLRELARGIYPPLLADQGLTTALEAQARKLELPVELDMEGANGKRFDTHTEAAAYFCSVEILRGDPHRLSVAVGNCLRIRADGGSIDEERLQAIEDRVEALEGSLSLGDARIELDFPLTNSDQLEVAAAQASSS